MGYWKGIDDSVELAQINLMETLARFLKKGDASILDVACGKGAASKFLTKYFDAKQIMGINISEKQLNICRVLAPECSFKLMDATELEFPDQSFDNVLSIEGAYHFMMRDRFLQEAHRVLKMGGRLAMSDIVLHDYALLDSLLPGSLKETWPEQNCLPDLQAYREALRAIGFRHVRIEDTTEYCIASWIRWRTQKAERDFDRDGPKILEQLRALEELTSKPGRARAWSWCMVHAIK